MQGMKISITVYHRGLFVLLLLMQLDFLSPLDDSNVDAVVVAVAVVDVANNVAIVPAIKIGTHSISIGTPAFLSSKMELDAQLDNIDFPQLDPPINGIINTHNIHATTAVFATDVATVDITVTVIVIRRRCCFGVTTPTLNFNGPIQSLVSSVHFQFTKQENEWTAVIGSEGRFLLLVVKMS